MKSLNLVCNVSETNVKRNIFNIYIYFFSLSSLKSRRQSSAVTSRLMTSSSLLAQETKKPPCMKSFTEPKVECDQLNKPGDRKQKSESVFDVVNGTVDTGTKNLYPVFFVLSLLGTGSY